MFLTWRLCVEGQHYILYDVFHDWSNALLSFIELLAWYVVQARFDYCGQLVCNQTLHGAFRSYYDAVFITNVPALGRAIMVSDIWIMIGRGIHLAWPLLCSCPSMPFPMLISDRSSLRPSLPSRTMRCRKRTRRLQNSSPAAPCRNAIECIYSCRVSSAVFGRNFEIIVSAGPLLGQETNVRDLCLGDFLDRWALIVVKFW